MGSAPLFLTLLKKSNNNNRLWDGTGPSKDPTGTSSSLGSPSTTLILLSTSTTNSLERDLQDVIFIRITAFLFSVRKKRLFLLKTHIKCSTPLVFNLATKKEKKKAIPVKLLKLCSVEGIL